MEKGVVDMGEAYDFEKARAEFIKAAEARGDQIVVPQPNQLQIDIDSETAMDLFIDRWASFSGEISEEYDGWTPTFVAIPSGSGLPHQHVTVTLPFEVSVWERIAWQAVLGSDLLREFMSALRAHRNDDMPTLFTEPGPSSSSGPESDG